MVTENPSWTLAWHTLGDSKVTKAVSPLLSGHSSLGSSCWERKGNCRMGRALGTGGKRVVLVEGRTDRRTGHGVVSQSWGFNVSSRKKLHLPQTEGRGSASPREV